MFCFLSSILAFFQQKLVPVSITVQPLRQIIGAFIEREQSWGYGVFNLRSSWQATPALQLAAGVDNLFDKEYADHLSGINRVRNSDIASGDHLPSYGVNVFARAVYEF